MAGTLGAPVSDFGSRSGANSCRRYPGKAEEPTVSPEDSSLTDEQLLVLEAIYNYFYMHATWPTFIVIDRPLRREHGIDTAAIILSLPESLIVPPRPGNLRPTAEDELQLRLLGIQSCLGGSDDTERFVRLLRWLARQEMAYEPEGGGGETMPRVTSFDVGVHLGLHHDDVALVRLYAMLQLDHWGLSGSGTGEDGWFVVLGPDIWRFRNVETVEDCIRVREKWVSEAQAKVPRMRRIKPLPAWHYHVRVSTKSKPDWDEVRLDLSEEELGTDFLAPYREGRPIVINGSTVPIDDLARLRISRSEPASTELRSDPRWQAELRKKRTHATPDEWLIASLCDDVTGEFITEAPGSAVVPTVAPNKLPNPTTKPYVDQRVIDEIQAKDGKSQFNVTKLRGLSRN